MAKKKAFKKSRRDIENERERMKKFKTAHPRTWNKFCSIRNEKRKPTLQELKKIAEEDYFGGFRSVRAFWSTFKNLTRFEEAPNDLGDSEVVARRARQNALWKEFAKIHSCGGAPDQAKFRELSDAQKKKDLKRKEENPKKKATRSVGKRENIHEHILMSTTNVKTSYKLFLKELKAGNLPNICAAEGLVTDELNGLDGPSVSDGHEIMENDREAVVGTGSDNDNSVQSGDGNGFVAAWKHVDNRARFRRIAQKTQKDTSGINGTRNNQGGDVKISSDQEADLVKEEVKKSALTSADITDCCLPIPNPSTDCYGITAVNLIYSIKVVRDRIKNLAIQKRTQEGNKWQLVKSLGNLFDRKENNFAKTREVLGFEKGTRDASTCLETILLRLEENGMQVPETRFEYLWRNVCEGGCTQQSDRICNPFNRITLKADGTLKNVQKLWESDHPYEICVCGARRKITKEARTASIGDYHILMVDHVNRSCSFAGSKVNDIVPMFGKNWRLIAFAEHLQAGNGHYVSWMRINQNSDASDWILVNDNETEIRTGFTIKLDYKIINILVFKKI